MPRFKTRFAGKGPKPPTYKPRSTRRERMHGQLVTVRCFGPPNTLEMVPDVRPKQARGRAK